MGEANELRAGTGFRCTQVAIGPTSEVNEAESLDAITCAVIGQFMEWSEPRQPVIIMHGD